MSIRVVYQDDSSEKLLVDTLSEEDRAASEEEDEDKSLASLLGIKEKDVINLDDDPTDTDVIEKAVDKYADDVNTTDDDDLDEAVEGGDDKPEHGDAVDVKEIEPDVDKEGDDTAEETHNDDDDEPNEKDEKKHPVDFHKLFGRDLDLSYGNKGPTPGTSAEDCRTQVQINDENEHESDPEKLRLLAPSPQRNDSVRPVTGVIQDRRQIERTLLKKQISQRGKLFCGIFVTLFMLCLSLGLLGLGWWFKVQDLYLVGGIFGGGTVVFFLIFIFIRCTSNTSVDYVTLHKLDSPEKNI